MAGERRFRKRREKAAKVIYNIVKNA